jgi:hypothetical protein
MQPMEMAPTTDRVLLCAEINDGEHLYVAAKYIWPDQAWMVVWDNEMLKARGYEPIGWWPLPEVSK